VMTLLAHLMRMYGCAHLFHPIEQMLPGRKRDNRCLDSHLSFTQQTP
jgi:hypothetical protein